MRNMSNPRLLVVVAVATTAENSGKSSASRVNALACSPCSSVLNTSCALAITAAGSPASSATWMP